MPCCHRCNAAGSNDFEEEAAGRPIKPNTLLARVPDSEELKSKGMWATRRMPPLAEMQEEE